MLSYHSFEIKIHCCLEKADYLQFHSWLAVRTVNCYGAEQVSSPLVASQAPNSVRQVKLTDT